MGRRKGSRNKSKTIVTERGHIAAMGKNPAVQKSSAEKAVAEPIKTKNAAIESERSKVVTKKRPVPLFDVQITDGDEKLNWLSKAMQQHFGFVNCGFRDGIRQWNFPTTIGDKFKRHTVFRQYYYRQIMVDVFDKGTSVKEIKRIKAHLEKLGHTYTYILGGEPVGMTMEVYMEEVFGRRMKRSSEAVMNKVKVPQSLAEANFAGHTTTAR